MQNKSSELLRNGKVPEVRSAWDIPTKTAASEMQRRSNAARTPAVKQYFHITPAGSHHRSQRISKVAI